MAEFDLETDYRAARLGVIGTSIYAERTDMTPFLEAGGKMIQWHGWNDSSTSGTISTHYYNQLADTVGTDRLDQIFRLFMAPGMEHCGRGPAPDAVGGAFGAPAASRDAEHDIMEALADWIEQDRAPENLIATKYAEDGSVAAQRP